MFIRRSITGNLNTQTLSARHWHFLNMNRNRRLLWQLYPSYLIITLLAVLAVSWYSSRSMRHFYLDQTESELHIQGRLLEQQLAGLIEPLDAPAVDRLSKVSAAGTETRVTVILPDGVVIGDSEENPAKMDSHRNRPEVLEALSGRAGTAIRYSGTLQQRMMYVAMPIQMNGNIAAVLRTSLPVTAIDEELHSIQIRIALAGFLIALMASGVCLYVSRRISLPIERLRQGAERFAGGDLKHRMHPPNTRELGGLAEAMNQMAEQLESRIEAVVNQRNEYEAVLASMEEGVVAIDCNERILSINQGAARTLNIQFNEAKGRSILETIRNRELQTIVGEVLTSGSPVSGDVNLRRNGDRVLNVHGTPLYDARHKHIGALLVLNDVTQMRRLENVRRDFVANVSHEIKTPLTAIKGFVETLLNGQGDRPEETQRFLGIIRKHVDRLNAILEDLLALARIEQKDEKGDILLERRRLKDVVETAIQVVQVKADEKQIQFDVACDTATSVRVDATLFEQALVNLLDNAVKYSPDASRVQIRTGQSDTEWSVAIRDFGPGISKNHLSRLFERFYRVDKARSRKMGGTGLGLAIVKHIIQAHGGRVTVESRLGDGSTFAVHLPNELLES